MNLSQTIQQAGELTQRLHEALETHDQDLCEDLLKRRDQAMAEFDKAHQEASRQDRAKCQDEVAALAEADRRLQDRSRERLALVRGEIRGQLGQSVQGKQSSSGETTQACLDRKA